MASSDLQIIPYVLSNLAQTEFKSVLDVGMGFGKYGYLIRDYFDLMKAEKPEEFKRENWRLKIDGVEAFEQFVGERQKMSYDDIHIGDCRDVVSKLGQYDVIIMIAALIHMSREDGLKLIREMYEHCDQYVLFTAPPVVLPQDDVFDNPYEIHHDVVWSPEDLKEFPRVIHGYSFNQKTQFFILPKPGVKVRYVDLFKPVPFARKIRPFIKMFVGERIAKMIGRFIHRKEYAERGV